MALDCTTQRLTVTSLHSDQGSVVVFDALDEEGKWVRFGADHRPAQEIIRALECAADDVEVEVESWQLV